MTSAWAEVDDVQSAKMCLEKALKGICAVEQEEVEGVIMKNGDLTDEGEGEGEGEGTGGEKALEPSSPPSPSSPRFKAPHKLDIVFDENLGREHIGKKIVRYQMNPRPDWGPLNRAQGG